MRLAFQPVKFPYLTPHGDEGNKVKPRFGIVIPLVLSAILQPFGSCLIFQLKVNIQDVYFPNVL